MLVNRSFPGSDPSLLYEVFKSNPMAYTRGCQEVTPMTCMHGCQKVNPDLYMVVRRWLYAWLPGSDPYDLYAWMPGCKFLFVPGSNVSNMQAVSISVTLRRMAPQLWELCNNNIWLSASEMRKLFCKKMQKFPIKHYQKKT